MALHNKPKSLLASNYPTVYTSSVKPLSVSTASYKPSQASNVAKETPKPTMVMPSFKAGPRVTSKEMDERRSKGLCFLCEEKYTPSHKCPRRKVYVMQLLEEVDGEEEENCQGENKEETPSELQLSLHAMWGLEGTQIMRIKGECQHRCLRILVDTCSTHNFLSKQVANKVRCDLVQVNSAAVEVANGQQLQCNQKCKKFEWEMQGVPFMAEVHVIPLEAYDLILGVQWLSTLGDISWNFNTLQMTFQIERVQHTLEGERWSPKDKHINCLSLFYQQDKWEGGGQNEEVKISNVVTASEGVFFLCHNIQQKQTWPELEQLLTEFA